MKSIYYYKSDHGSNKLSRVESSISYFTLWASVLFLFVCNFGRIDNRAEPLIWSQKQSLWLQFSSTSPIPTFTFQSPMAPSKKEKPAKKSAIHDVITRDYTIRTTYFETMLTV